MAGERIRIENFSGEIPRRSNRLLPPTHAQSAFNAKLYSGELRGLRQLKPLRSAADNTLKTYRLPDPLGVDGSTWVDYDSLDYYLYRGPLLNDEFDRYYQFGGGDVPRYNTLTRIRSGDPWFLLGIPTPIASPGITPVGGTGTEVTRFYTYTFVSAYGEEGPPVDPGPSVSGPEDATWEITNLDVTVPDAAERNITHKRIYRTVAGFGIAEFFFVAEVPLNQSLYFDTASAETISRNSILESSQWFPPPDDIESALVMPNGFFVAWQGRDVYFSESYRPHAWPPAYGQSTEFDVVGGGVYGQSVALVTEGNPYIGTGITPDSMTLTKVNTVEPGLSKYGIVSLSYGVLYPSQNGLVMLNASGVNLVTRPLLTKEEWLGRFSPTTVVAAQYLDSYIAFYGPVFGYLLNPAEETAAFVELDQFSDVRNVQTDPFTGEVFIVKRTPAGPATVYEWDAIDQIRVAYTWRSKDFSLDKPVNFGALELQLRDESSGNTDISDAQQAWNAERIAAGPLNTIGIATFGGSYRVALTGAADLIPQNKLPIGGSTLYGTATTLQGVLRLNVYADYKLIYSELWRGNKRFRLPSGFKSELWSFELIGDINVFAIDVAETGKGLRDV